MREQRVYNSNNSCIKRFFFQFILKVDKRVHIQTNTTKTIDIKKTIHVKTFFKVQLYIGSNEIRRCKFPEKLQCPWEIIVTALTSDHLIKINILLMTHVVFKGFCSRGLSGTLRVCTFTQTCIKNCQWL